MEAAPLLQTPMEKYGAEKLVGANGAWLVLARVMRRQLTSALGMPLKRPTAPTDAPTPLATQDLTNTDALMTLTHAELKAVANDDAHAHDNMTEEMDVDAQQHAETSEAGGAHNHDSVPLVDKAPATVIALADTERVVELGVGSEPRAQLPADAETAAAAKQPSAAPAAALAQRGFVPPKKKAAALGFNSPMQSGAALAALTAAAGDKAAEAAAPSKPSKPRKA
ncbi:hypothetical protein T492DRAFT_896887, partial [Pavlovales sp. CCMP2436]